MPEIEKSPARLFPFREGGVQDSFILFPFFG